MLDLETKIEITDELCSETNLCHHFSDEDLTKIGGWVWNGYQADEQSRKQWATRTEAAMDLAMQVQKDKSFPWVGASNIAFPLITIAAMEFHSRAYPALIQGVDLVKMRVPFPDPAGENLDRAQRVGGFMSYQLLEEDEDWEEQQDRALLQVPIVGCAFKKTYFKAREGYPDSDLVPAAKLVMNYYSKSVETCPRKTHLIELSRNEVYERCKAKVFRDFLEEPWYQAPFQAFSQQEQPVADQRKGMQPPTPDESTPVVFLEQHCWIDFDGDGYAEPYIITVDAVNKYVARITARWDQPEDVERLDGEILKITATEYFTKYGLIPSPDGSIYDIGFGAILGPLNESVNSIVNQLVDAGTLANTSGGFLARGVKTRSGAYSFRPFGWQRVDCTGEDLKNGVFPFPVRDPSQVMFTLLSFLVNYTQRISGSTDVLSGQNPGQNTPAQTTQELVAQGMRIYSALFKRMWRCMKEEFRKIYILNGKYLPTERTYGEGTKISREDFLHDPSQIAPAADPNVVSEQMRVQLAMMVADRARAVPGYNIEATERNLHRAINLEASEVLYPGPDKVPPLPNPKVQVEQMKVQVAQMKLEIQKQEMLLNIQEQRRLNDAQITKLFAQAEQLSAQAQATEDGHQIELINALIGAARAHNDHLAAQADQLIKVIGMAHEQQLQQQQSDAAPPAVPAGPAGQ